MTQPALLTWSMKELRALFPMWLACVIAVALHNQMAGSFLPTFSVLAYGFGSIALGAQSIGHEYGYGTLGMLLSQPADRRRMFLVKLVVLASLLIALAVVAWLTLLDSGLLRPTPRRIVGDYDNAARMVLLVGLSGLFIAPALTILTRSWIAGVVFTIGLVGVLRVGAQLIGWARFGALEPGAADRFTEAVFWPAMVGVWALGTVASWRLFRRLEALDGHGTEIQLSRWLPHSASAAAPARRRGAVWQLVMKELHLHQMAFFLAAAHAAGMLLLAFAGNIDPHHRREIAGPLTIIYIGGVTTLIGAMASAEERQIGSLQWHLLMPMAVWRQWTVKVIVVLVLAFALGLGLPSILAWIAPPLPQVRPELGYTVVSILLVACASLYVSSLCTGGVRAMVVSLPALLAAGTFSHWFVNWLNYTFFGLSWYTSPFTIARGNPLTYHVPWLAIGMVVAIIGGTLLVMAYRNHRSGDRPWQRIAAQIALFAAILCATLVVGRLLGV